MTQTECSLTTCTFHEHYCMLVHVVMETTEYTMLYFYEADIKVHHTLSAQFNLICFFSTYLHSNSYNFALEE